MNGHYRKLSGIFARDVNWGGFFGLIPIDVVKSVVFGLFGHPWLSLGLVKISEISKTIFIGPFVWLVVLYCPKT